MVLGKIQARHQSAQEHTKATVEGMNVKEEEQQEEEEKKYIDLNSCFFISFS